MHVQCTTLFLCKLPKTTCSHHPLTLMLVSHSGHGSAFSAALPCPSYVHSAHIDTHTRHRQRRTHQFTLVSDFIPFPSTLCYSALSTHESPPPSSAVAVTQASPEPSRHFLSLFHLQSSLSITYFLPMSASLSPSLPSFSLCVTAPRILVFQL